VPIAAIRQCTPRILQYATGELCILQKKFQTVVMPAPLSAATASQSMKKCLESPWYAAVDVDGYDIGPISPGLAPALLFPFSIA
jgi:hypothetical protein